MKKSFSIVIIVLTMSITNGCVKEVKDTIDSLECASLMARIEQGDDETCADVLAVIDKVEKSCGEFLSDDSKEQIAVLRANCTEN